VEQKNSEVVIDDLAGLVNARGKTCLDSGIKSWRVNKWSH